jgi:hypothetical protein
MSLRADRIKRARRRVDARRAALGNYADRRRDDIRDRARATYGRNLGKTKFGKPDKVQRRGIVGDLAQLNKDASQLPVLKELNQLRDDAWSAGKEGIYGLGHGAAKLIEGMLGSWNEGQEARKDDKKWTYGGDPLDIGKGTMTDNWMQTQILPEYMDEYERERDKGNLHWRELNEYTGGRTGIAERINTLNNLTPERLSKYSPIKQRNILESIVNPAEADAFRRSAAGKEGIVDDAMLMDYINRAKELYGSAGLPSIAVDDEIMNYRDPIRDRVAQTGTGQSTIPYQNAEDVLINEVPSNISAIDYGEPNLVDDDILYGEPGNQPLNTILQGIYPNYTPNPILNELEDMDEQALLDWGAQNPIAAKSLGFNPYYSNMWLD